MKDCGFRLFVIEARIVVRVRVGTWTTVTVKSLGQCHVVHPESRDFS